MRGLNPCRCFAAMDYWGTQDKAEASLSQSETGVAWMACVGLEVSQKMGFTREVGRGGSKLTVHRCY